MVTLSDYQPAMFVVEGFIADNSQKGPAFLGLLMISSLW